MNAIHTRITSTQNRKWAIIQEEFKSFEQKIHIRRDCTKMLFSNEQLNFNFDLLSSLLAMIHAGIRRYCSVLFAFRMNILNPIPVILRGHIPMSLFPMD